MPEINSKMKKLIPEKITAYYKIECVYGVMAFTALLIAGCKSRMISINSGYSDVGDFSVVTVLRCWGHRGRIIMSVTFLFV